MGLGSINKIIITNEGIGLRSFMDWKLKKQFFITGGFELNYNAAFNTVLQLKDANYLQQSCLIGISKKISIKTKLTKGTKLQWFYDVLAHQQETKTKRWVFRVGYQF